MKKKASKSTTVSPLESIRKASAYDGMRAFFGMPFILVGCGFFVLSLIPGLLGLQLFLDDGLLKALPLWVPAMVLLISGLFFFSLSALGSAIFDIADCAVRSEARAAQREAREAYDAYRAAQNLGHAD